MPLGIEIFRAGLRGTWLYRYDLETIILSNHRQNLILLLAAVAIVADGEIAGPLAEHIPFLKLVGRHPGLYTTTWGPNSLRKVGQEATGGALGKSLSGDDD
jgi:hypothetical protein